ncbi:hypothetical protein J3R30DRAFT_2726859 [Lentinula aciculospora]|uniref:Btz domain-containing protein n=1 Tax=Lentinula aciculospora TaxID=153920 RepID=A0A9W9AC09_9AGAR|nr:hypothetical protein J3R30DRAFT_2726859 [Lentinula aciculospora]
MSTPVASSTSNTASNMADNNFASRTAGSLGKRRRFGRRRGRKPSIDSGDEVEREVRTDSESEDDLSSSESTSDSDTEPASDDVLPNEQPRVLTPSTSQSPEGASHLLVNGHSQPFFGSSGNWSEMVANEAENGPESLPVIDFTELDSQVLPLSNQSRKSKKNQKHNNNRASAPSLPPAQPVQPSTLDEPEVSRPLSSHSVPRRPPGQSARQAYQQRLEADPSYVPTVGEFWGHDDRLLDKNLRSLSGWWRGRWQGGVRGRGSFRGRGGLLGRPFAAKFDAEHDMEEDGAQSVDQAWTHDRFEESKQIEEGDSTSSHHQTHHPIHLQNLQYHEFNATRGRVVSFAGRGRRGGRGAFSPPLRGRQIHIDPGRVWFLKKPEHMWTKQAESYLFSDPLSKPRAGHPAFVHVKLPSQKTPSIRVPIQSLPQAISSKSSITLPGSDYGDKVLVVRIPKPVSSEKPEVTEPDASPPPIDEPSIEEVFTVRPRLVSPKIIPLPDQPTTRKLSVSGTHTVSSSITSVDPVIQQKLEQLSLEPQKTDPTRWVQTEEAVMRNPTGTVPEEQLHVSSMFTRPDPVSPSYGSPYQYVHPLPPGLALNPAGMAYEVALGRPVYLQPPSNLYTPSMMQPVPFVPGHVHHHSVSSSDFIPGAGTNSPINDGGYMQYVPIPPIFSFPRQSSRVQIRVPDEPKQHSPLSADTDTAAEQQSSSELRSDAVAFEPSEQYFPEANGLPTDSQQQVQDPMMGYYNPYYYPDPSYGYNPYIDMSQVAPYEMYPPQGAVYYQ